MVSRRSSCSPSALLVSVTIACCLAMSAVPRRAEARDIWVPAAVASTIAAQQRARAAALPPAADSPKRTAKALEASSKASDSAAPAIWPLIVIDPGHGGAKLGTVSADGIAEKALALQMAARLERELARSPVRVRLTRTKDVHLDLKDRIELANADKAALFVSIHLNAMPAPGHRRTHGVETYFLARHATGERAEAVAAAENAEDDVGDGPGDDLSFILADLAETEAHRDASQLAYTVHENLISRLKARDRGVHQAPFRVLKGAQMPAILVEVGYLSHPGESRRLKDATYQKKIARALAHGLLEFLDKRGLIAPPTRSAGNDMPAAAQREVSSGP